MRSSTPALARRSATPFLLLFVVLALVQLQFAPASADEPVTFGKWSVVCPPATAQNKVRVADDVALRRCRAQLLIHPDSDPGKTALAAIFRFVVGDDSTVSLILHVPPPAAGIPAPSQVLVAFTEDQVIALPVISCSADRCTALGMLKQDVFNTMLVHDRVAVVIPNGPGDDENIVVPLPLTGLPDAMAAMRKIAD
jgi:invasion protein IalB